MMGMGWLWLLLILFAAYVLFATVDKNSSPGSAGGYDTPLDILKKRYARGEITREQFEEMKKNLQ